MTHFQHVDRDGDSVAIFDSVEGRENVLVQSTNKTGYRVTVRVPGEALRDALLRAFPLPEPEDAEFDAWSELDDETPVLPEALRDVFGDDRPEFRVGDRVQYHGLQYLEPGNREGAGTIKYVYDNGGFGVEQDDGGRVFSYFDHQLEHITDVDAWEEAAFGLGDILRSAEEYAAPRAAHAYATAFSAFVASLHPVE